MASFIPRDNGKIQVKIRMKGVSLSQTFPNKKMAQKWATTEEARIIEEKVFNTTKRLASEMIDRYIETKLQEKDPVVQRDQERQLNWFKDRLEGKLVNEITPSLCSELKDELTKKIHNNKTISPSTVNRYFAAFSHCMTITVKEWGWLERNPLMAVSKLKEAKGRTRFLSEDEIKRFLEACKKSKSPDLYSLVVLALCTGCRRGELLKLEWNDVDFKRNLIILRDTKNGDHYNIPLLGLAKPVLQERYDRGLERPFLCKDPKTAFKVALRNAEIEDFRFHDTRHTALSYLAMNGATDSELMAIGRWKSRSMVTRYAHLREGHTTGLVSNMVSKIGLQGPPEAEI